MKRRPSHRVERVGAQIRQALALAIGSELKDPRVGFVTVTHVQVSADLSHAKVYVSVMGEEADKAEAIEGLKHARGFLRTYLARQLPLRTTPELHFQLDRGLEHAKKIDSILRDTEDHEEAP